jgi:hypothetical protein
MHGGDTIYWSESRKEDTNWKTGVDERMTLRWILRKQDVSVVDCIHEVEDRDQWQTPVNTTINLLIPQKGTL